MYPAAQSIVLTRRTRRRARRERRPVVEEPSTTTMVLFNPEPLFVGAWPGLPFHVSFVFFFVAWFLEF
jgi:hypothetical protein